MLVEDDGELDAPAFAGVAVTGSGAIAHGQHDDGAPFPEHPHVLLVKADVRIIEGEHVLVGAEKCVDLAAGNRLPLNAHHNHTHFGKPGEMLTEKAGHVVAPAAPFPVPWSDCASLFDFFGLPD